MDILISWSKQRSKVIATAFKNWLPQVLPGVQPWMSAIDIAKGKEWFRELQQVLGDATACIICVTDENIRSPWIYMKQVQLQQSVRRFRFVRICLELVRMLSPMGLSAFGSARLLRRMTRSQ